MTSRINLEGVVGVAKVDIGWTAPQIPGDFEAPDLEQGIHFRGVF